MIDWLLLCVGISLTLIAGGLYVAIMGPSRFHRHGYVGALYRWMRHSFMDATGSFCCCLMCCCRREVGNKAWGRFFKYVVGRNWILVGVYVGFVWTVEILYLFLCLPNLRVPVYSKIVSWALVIVAEFLYGMAVFSDPGTVSKADELGAQIRERVLASELTAQSAKRAKKIPNSRSQQIKGKSSHQHKQRKSYWWCRAFNIEEEYIMNRRYPVDGMLYSLARNPALPPPTTSKKVSETTFCNSLSCRVGFGMTCDTCKLPKPSRSKHCSLCGHCVRRFDHHCPWINNDVAENTQRYFIGFLFVHAISCIWGALDLYAIMKQFLIDHHLWGWQFRRGNRVIPLGVVEYLTLLTSFQLLPLFLFLFAVALAVVLVVFWGYVMTFAYSNLTMNDMNKIDEVLFYLDSIGSVSELYSEACRIRDRLVQVSPQQKRLKYLLALPPPPPYLEGCTSKGPTGKNTPEKSSLQIEKDTRKYRNEVRSSVNWGLRGIYDRGIIRNLLEVFFPSSCITHDLLEDVQQLLAFSRAEWEHQTIYGNHIKFLGSTA